LRRIVDLPPIEYHDSKLDNNLEMVIDQLFEDWMGLKELKSLKTILTKVFVMYSQQITLTLNGVKIQFRLC
jgi:hypothetical protein